MSTLRPKHGFTLLELLIAIALLGLLSASVFAFMWHLFDREERTLVLARRTQTATVLFDRIERDLLTAVTATAEGPGIVGDDHGITIAHRAVFVGGQNSPHTDLQRTTIHFDRARHELTLVREDAFEQSEPEGDGTRPEAVPGPRQSELDGVLAMDIRAVRFRYHDGRTWRSSFTSSRKLPVAVEVAIWFDRGTQDEDTDDRAAPPGFAPDDFDPVGEFGSEFDPDLEFDRAMLGPTEEEGTPTTEPDRLRVIVIPDARDQPPAGGGGALP